MNNKEAIDFAESYLMQQKERCVDPATYRCVYWRSDGNMCLIGALLGSELAEELSKDATLAFSPWRTIAEAAARSELAARCVAKLAGVSTPLLNALQAVHDAARRMYRAQRTEDEKLSVVNELRQLRVLYI